MSDKSRFFAAREEILPFNPSLAPEIDGEPTCPKELDALGKKKWRDLTKMLAAVGTLNKIDRDVLRIYCETYSQYEHALKAMKDGGGPILKGKRNAGAFRNPWLEVANHTARELTRLSKLIGIDKASQKKLGMLTRRIGGVSTRDRSKGPPPPTAKGAS